MNEPITIVIFGITGDLARKKLLPACFYLWSKGIVKDLSIVGFSRRDLSNRQLREEVADVLPESASEKEKKKFLSLISYKQGIFDDDKSYQDLHAYLSLLDKEIGECARKLFYLAVPPSLYENILTKLYHSGLHIHCGTKERETKILIEKPFGADTRTAEHLDNLLGKWFGESQVFRIDHYLSKESLQNILAFRFSNTLFEPIWNSKNIEKVEINLYEKNTVGSRGAFYDKIGALKDVGQNHLLAMLSLVAMEKPKTYTAKDIRIERENVIKKTRVSKEGRHARAQYEGYLSEEGVEKKSKTETYFELWLEVANKRWKGVPFVLKSGKAMSESKTEIVVYFKDPDPKSFLQKSFEGQETNTLTFRIQPNEGIDVLFWIKVPGFANKIEPRKLSFNYKDVDQNIPDAYARVLFDCIVGDQTLFPTTAEIMGGWRVIEEAFVIFEKIPLKKYRQGEFIK